MGGQLQGQIGALMGYATEQAALQRFQMSATYQARLARSIKMELEKGTHYLDVKTAVKLLLRRQLSPALLAKKVEDLHRLQVVKEPDPYAELPQMELDPSWLETEV